LGLEQVDWPDQYTNVRGILFILAFVTIGETALGPGHAAPLLEHLGARAVEHGEEHVIKLTEAAVREFRHRGDTTLLAAADRFRERVPAT
jgi:hypothetical protein